MATTLNRGSTWTNSDGLIVGFGSNKAATEGGDHKNYAGYAGLKTAAVTFAYTDTGVNVPIPAGSKVIGVQLHVGTAWAGGTAINVGDGNSATGFITSTAGALANLTANAKIYSDGAYAYGATDTVAHEQKLYSAADTIDVSYSGTFTAGTATLVVSYL